MKKFLPALFLLPTLVLGADKSPDQSFYDNAAEGGIAEVELGKLAQEKGTSAAVKEFGAMMVKDHSAANMKLKAVAAKKGVELPTKPGMMQMATKTKLEVLSGGTFDKSYIRGMVDDHQKDIALFEKEAKEGKDADAKAFATATLPTLRTHLKHVQEIATKMGVDAN
jgi:putative membrane protein